MGLPWDGAAVASQPPLPLAPPNCPAAWVARDLRLDGKSKLQLFHRARGECWRVDIRAQGATTLLAVSALPALRPGSGTGQGVAGRGSAHSGMPAPWP